MGHENDYNDALKFRCPNVTAVTRPRRESLLDGPIETYVKREVATAVAARLAALEASDPTQARPNRTTKPYNRTSILLIEEISANPLQIHRVFAV